MSHGHTVQLIHNRSAGRHCRVKLAALRQGFEASGARVIVSECGPGCEIVISDEASHVCALGGDGTARHVAQALARSGRSLPMSVYPLGTVNLLHREMLGPLEPDRHALRLLGGEDHRDHYSVEINDTIFLACASVGPDSHAVAALSSPLKRLVGKAAYGAAFLKVLAKWPRHRITLVADERELTCEAFYVAKGRYFAGPWSFAPDAALGTPLLHVVALERTRRRDYARFTWALLRGKPVDQLPGVTAFTCTKLEATSDAPLPIQADGDIIANLPAKLEISKAPLSFC